VSRTISIVALFAVIAPSILVLTVLLPSPESKLPACCRRDGKHHCAMAEMTAGKKQVKALASTCPFRSLPFVTPHVKTYLPQASLTNFAGLKSHPAVHAQTFTAFRVAQARSHHKRGPPLAIIA
jgi:hypothetical protein